MSSLAAARADGFYYPPQYDGSKHGSINKFNNSHPLGVRAKNISQGILVIRFEMPFKVWCTSCNSIIDQGVRFDAEKKKVGCYHTSPIYEFRFTCPHCPNSLAITTNPKEAKYELTEGLRQKVEIFSPEDAGTIALPTTEEREKLRSDPMYKLEVTNAAKEKASSEAQRIRDLYDLQRQSHHDSYATNSTLRTLFRNRKKQEIEDKKKREKVRNFCMPLVAETVEDIVEAHKVDYRTDQAVVNSRAKRKAVEQSSIFPVYKRPGRSGSVSEVGRRKKRVISGSTKTSSSGSSNRHSSSSSSSSNRHSSSSSSSSNRHSSSSNSSSSNSSSSSRRYNDIGQNLPMAVNNSNSINKYKSSLSSHSRDSSKPPRHTTAPHTGEREEGWRDRRAVKIENVGVVKREV
eukprot:GHVQ01019915.1.p1 GENE.GHVQ01019915.1~~GHVQ01019915.1.p1  ORF type:complete len:403 (+),score=100.53 GHVQ01019915.1:213-1421(+)